MKKLAMCVAVMSLAACSGGPSDKDIEAVLKKELAPVLEAQKQLASALGGNSAELKKMTIDDFIKSTKSLGCKKDGDAAFICDVEVEVVDDVATKATKKETEAMRFVKATDGWTATKMR